MTLVKSHIEKQPFDLEEFIEGIEVRDSQNTESIAQLIVMLEKTVDSFNDNVTKVIKSQPQQEQIDLTPLITIASDIGKQNKAILDAIIKLTKSDKSQYDELLKLALSTIRKNNEFLQDGIAKINYTTELQEIGTQLENRPKEWEFEVIYHQKSMFIQKVIAKAK